VLRHRGPDDQGTYIDDGVGLGMRRLEVIDPAGGHQPIHNEDERLWIVFNGEIYNFPALRDELAALGHRSYTRTDTETVLHAYEQWGPDCLGRLNGMFAFAIWDTRARRLFLARDRVGIKPLYYSAHAGIFGFSSELRALLQLPHVRREVDPIALNHYLALGYVPSPYSIMKHIAKLPPGHHLEWDQTTGESSLRQYWDMDLAEGAGGPPREDTAREAERLVDVLREAVRLELISDVPLGVFLSGGIDSSAVAAMMTEITPGNVQSFSIGFTDRSFDESASARLVARHLGTVHHELVLDNHELSDAVPRVSAHLDEPFADASVIPTVLLSEFTRRHVKVALGGDGGDELFAGYPTLQAHRLAGYYNRLPFVLRGRMIPALVRRLPVSHDNISFDFKAKRFISGAGQPVANRHTRWLGPLGPEARVDILSGDCIAAIGNAADLDVVNAHARVAESASMEALNQVLYLDMKLYLEGDILVKLDRASMSASLEARVPMLNKLMLEHVRTLPLNLKLRGLKSKHVLKRALAGRLPEHVLTRGKKGFGIPVARMIRGPLREQVEDALSADTLRQEGFFNPAAVRRLLDDHIDGRQDNRMQLWTLFMFERWYENQVRSSAVAAIA